MVDQVNDIPYEQANHLHVRYHFRPPLLNGLSSAAFLIGYIKSFRSQCIYERSYQAKGT